MQGTAKFGRLANPRFVQLEQLEGRIEKPDKSPEQPKPKPAVGDIFLAFANGKNMVFGLGSEHNLAMDAYPASPMSKLSRGSTLSTTSRGSTLSTTSTSSCVSAHLSTMSPCDYEPHLATLSDPVSLPSPSSTGTCKPPPCQRTLSHVTLGLVASGAACFEGRGAAEASLKHQGEELLPKGLLDSVEFEAPAEDRSPPKGKHNGGNSGPKNRWWAQLPPELCPVSKFPICLLPYPPFKLCKDPKEPGSHRLVDGKSLAIQVCVSRNVAVLGRKLRASDLNALDEYVQRCKLGPFRPKKAANLRDAIKAATDERTRDWAVQDYGRFVNAALIELSKVRSIQEKRMLEERRKNAMMSRHSQATQSPQKASVAALD